MEILMRKTWIYDTQIKYPDRKELPMKNFHCMFVFFVFFFENRKYKFN